MLEMPKEKISVVLEHYDVGGVRWPPFDVENLWVRSLGAPYYEVASIPFYAVEVNFGDAIEAHAREGHEVPVLAKVIRRSGYWTARIAILDGREDDAQLALDRLGERGCTIDRDEITGVAAVGVPPVLDAAFAYEVFENGIEDGVWDVEMASKPVGDDG